MKVGIIGLPQTGKTTLYNALTRGQESTAPTGGAKREAAAATVAVPDNRYDFAVKLFSPKKQTPASIEFVDGAAPFGTGDKTFSADFFAGLRKVDALVLVVRAFEADYPPAPEGGIRPGNDIRTVAEEMLLGDMALIETRLERIEKALKTRKASTPAPELIEKEVLLKLQAHMEAGQPLRTVIPSLTPEELRQTRSFAFLTEKPIMAVANIGESDIGKPDAKLAQEAQTICTEENIPLIALCAKAEEEVAQLDDPDEEKEFLTALGIEEPARNRLIRLAYDTLGLMSFFTVGEDEVRAWTVEKGSSAAESAGKIHSDLEKFFIRAEVLEFDKLISAGSWDAAKPQMHLEMKDYPVKDGDILHIRAKKV